MTASLLLGAIVAVINFQLLIGICLVFWRLRHKGAAPEPVDGDALTRSTGAWSGWREFIVDSDRFEDPAGTQRSLILKPVDGLTLPDFSPGQYLTLSIPLSGGSKKILVRCYSLSDMPNGRTYRITVKRMPAPSMRPDLLPGAGSTYLHDAVQVGGRLTVKAPAGIFVLNTSHDSPAVFIAGGIGVTPMIGMIKWSQTHQPDRPLYLFYGVRNSADHAFKMLLEQLARSVSAFTLTVLYGAPGPTDVEGRDFHYTGFVDVALLKRILPHGRHQFYVCGPPAMMASLLPALAEWGVPQADIHFEAFGPASPGYGRSLKDTGRVSLQKVFDIRFRKSRRTLSWTGEDSNLLDFAERHTLSVESGCRTGSCGSCETRLLSGAVRYERKPDFEVTADYCLLCVGIPMSPLVLEA